jgi:hypothetical protein
MPTARQRSRPHWRRSYLYEAPESGGLASKCEQQPDARGGGRNAEKSASVDSRPRVGAPGGRLMTNSEDLRNRLATAQDSLKSMETGFTRNPRVMIAS